MSTPNLGLPLQPRDNPDWDVPLNAALTTIDTVVGGGIAAEVLTSNGPNSAPSYQPVPPPVGVGTVTSVGLSVPGELLVANSPVTSAGTLAVTKATQPANQVWAGPTIGAATQPTFRALVGADIPFALPAFDAAPAWWGSFEGGPFPWQGWPGGSNGQWGVGGGAGANVVKFCMVRLSTLIAVTKLTYYQLSTLAGSVSGFAYYDRTGQTKIFSWDNIPTGSGSAGTKTTVLGQTYLLPAGIYVVACANSMNGTSPTTLGGYGTSGTNEPVESWNTNGTVRTGVASNPMVAGVMPSALGALSISANISVSLPSITMEP